jgi:predicted ABC-type exoprotein transport system permease subunit
MKKLIISAFIIVIMLIGSVSAQDTQISVEIYYNAKNRQSQDTVNVLIEGLRFQDKLDIIHNDVSTNPDYAMLVSGLAQKLPEDLQNLVDVIMIIGKDIELYGSRHIQQYMNQAILYKMGMKVEIPPSFTPLPEQVNPLDSVNIKLNIVIALLCFIVLFQLKKIKNWFSYRNDIKNAKANIFQEVSLTKGLDDENTNS